MIGDGWMNSWGTHLCVTMGRRIDVMNSNPPKTEPTTTSASCHAKKKKKSVINNNTTLLKLLKLFIVTQKFSSFSQVRQEWTQLTLCRYTAQPNEMTQLPFEQIEIKFYRKFRQQQHSTCLGLKFVSHTILSFTHCLHIYL